MRRKIVINILIILAALGLLFLIWQCYFFYRVPLISTQVSTAIKVYPNESIQAVAAELKKQNIIQNPAFFAWVFTVLGYHLHFGEYQLQYPITTWRLMKNMSSGSGLVKHKFTIVEGWTLSDILSALAKNP